jgi:hypothetical protein
MMLYPATTSANSTTNTTAGESDIVFDTLCSIEAVATFNYGNARVVLVLLNPVVYYSYRNFYIIRASTLCFNFVVPDHIPVRLLAERVSSAKTILLKRGINVSIDTGVEYLKLYSPYSPHVTVASYIYIDFTNKSIREIREIIDVVGSLFSDLNATIVIYDTRLRELHKLYEERGVLEISRLGPIEGEVLAIVDEIEGTLRECINYIGGFPGVRLTPTFKAWWYLFHMFLDPDKPYCTIEDSIKQIEPHLKKMIDIIRDNLIPEEIPLYAMIDRGRVYFIPDILYIEEPIPIYPIETPTPYTPDTSITTLVDDTSSVKTPSPLIHTQIVAIIALLVTTLTALTMYLKRSIGEAHA